MHASTWMYILLFLFALLIYRFIRYQIGLRQSRYIGRQGERVVANSLAKLPRPYVVMNDLMLMKGDGRTAQIDHVVTSPYGIFVIETKFRHGHIAGDANTALWKQQIGSKHHTFENPLHQNAVHVRTIQEHVPFIDKAYIHSFVVFPDEMELTIHNAPSVVHVRDLLTAIRHHNLPCLSQDTARRVQETLESQTIQGNRARRSHIRDVKAHHQS